jgi:hypothetical protein
VPDFRIGGDHFLETLGAKYCQVERHGHDDHQVSMPGDLTGDGCIGARSTRPPG